jgi:3-carboxy-cis,cis-muconate cycloisomerase
MPQKSNPITSELILAAARTNASLLSALHQAQIQEHERATHGWQVEWLTLPQMMILTGGALKHALDLAQNMQVDQDAMRANIAQANDVVLAEAAVFALAHSMPRAKAEELVKNACASAISQAKPLIDVVRETVAVPDGTVDWQALSDPANYLGETDRIIAGVLDRGAELLSK